MSLPIRILAAAGLLITLLVGLVVVEDRARAAGREVVLPMEAVDPRDLLTGHYIDLQLIQRLPSADCPPNLPNPGRPGWLALRAAGGRHLLVGGATSREAALRLGDAAVRGTAYCLSIPDADGREGRAAALEIGVRRLHADQDEALAIEAQLRDRRPGAPATAFAVISVGEDGRARLKGIVLDGRRTDLTWW
jgi:hypothetical protein